MQSEGNMAPEESSPTDGLAGDFNMVESAADRMPSHEMMRVR